jgi:GxxExxY protein
MGEDRKHKHWELTNKIIQCAINVQKSIGPGYDKSVYKNAMAVEMTSCGLKHEEEAMIKVFHRQVHVGLTQADSVVEDAVVLKYRCREKLSDENFAKEIYHINSSEFEIGLLLNFGGQKIQVKRIYNNVIGNGVNHKAIKASTQNSPRHRK